MQKLTFSFLIMLIMAAIIITVLVLFQSDLTSIHAKIQKKFKNVEHISASELTELNNKHVVIFDVREREEYEVSHLHNAIHISPSMSADAFFKKYESEITDKYVIFYCSVGYRSSAYIDKLIQLKATYNMVNLKGGLFMWSNQNRAMQGEGIHPYNDYWGKLISHKEKIRYTPFVNAN